MCPMFPLNVLDGNLTRSIPERKQSLMFLDSNSGYACASDHIDGICSL